MKVTTIEKISNINVYIPDKARVQQKKTKNQPDSNHIDF